MSSLRHYTNLLRRTPLHPQWLLGRRRPPAGLNSARGMVLDIGSADRWIIPHLSPEARYLALDYPTTNAEFYGIRPDVFGDASRLPFSDACIDHVICTQVIEHLRDPVGALREMSRVLKPEGLAWLSIPFAYPIHNAPYDFQRHTEFGIRRDAALANLDLLRMERSHHALVASAFLLCMSIAGAVDASSGIRKALLLPVAAAAIVATNATAWLASRLWPDWDNLTLDYILVLRKPGVIGQAETPEDA